MPPGRRRNHHIVSRGYQRLFARRGGEQIALHDMREGWTRPVGTRNAFAKDDFNSYTDQARGKVDTLEDEWQRVEDVILPAVRALAAGDDAALPRDAARVLAAVHFARSYSFDVAVERVTGPVRETIGDELGAMPKIRQQWVKERGREPLQGEIEAEITESWVQQLATGVFRLERMVVAYEKVLEKLRPLEVQIIRASPRRVPFIFGDTPVVHSARFPGSERGPAFRVGVKHHLALGDADYMYMPLGPWVAVMFTTEVEGDPVASPMMVQQLNWQLRRGCWRFLAGHPDTDFARAIAGG